MPKSHLSKSHLFGFVAAFVLLPLAAAAQPSSLTAFFSTSDLSALAKSPDVLNMEAQSADGSGQSDVNAFDDFFLINGAGRLVVNFDRALAKKGQVAIGGWIGVARYSNHAISADIQAGFEKVKAKYSLTGLVGHVTIYKTLNTAQLVYDYAVELSPGGTQCQEYLYTPVSGAMQLGLRVNCRWTLQHFMPPQMESSGHLKK